jgi:hypothetical protein
MFKYIADIEELIIKEADPLLGLPPQLIEKLIGTGEGWLFR